jgi:hypothetical protein
MAQATTPPGNDAALAARLGADDYGMRSYVLVVLKTGPNWIAPGSDRDEMFRGHFAYTKRLSDKGKLILAGPFDGVHGWRGLFVFAAPDIDEANPPAATDPVLVRVEMMAAHHKHYGTAALMFIPEIYERLAKKRM